MVYNRDMQNNVKLAFQSVISEPVSTIEHIAIGETNKVFKITTDTNIYILRIFRYENNPEPGLYKKLEELLRKNLVQHAKIRYETRESTHFENGFMIMEYIEGNNGQERIESNAISFEDFFQKHFSLLYSIHSIQLSTYGSLTGNTTISDWIDGSSKFIQRDKKYCRQIPNIDQRLVDRAIQTVQSQMNKYKQYLQPSVVHGDPTPNNTVITQDKKIYLIDWDSAYAGTWYEDIAWITYFGAHLSVSGSREERRKRLHTIVFNIYQDTIESQDVYLQIENALHIKIAFSLLPYYFFVQENMEAFDITYSRLQSLLSV